MKLKTISLLYIQTSMNFYKIGKDFQVLLISAHRFIILTHVTFDK